MTPLARYHYIENEQLWRGPSDIPVGGGGAYIWRDRSNTGLVGAGIDEGSLTSEPGGYRNVSNLTLINKIITGDVTLVGSNNHLIGCKITGSLNLRQGTNNSIVNSDVGAVSFQSVQTGLVEQCYITGKEGTDAAGVTSDFSMCQDITYLNNSMGNPILTSGSHYDTIQVRGVNGLELIGNTMDHGDTFDSSYNATIFIMTELGGASNITIRGNHLKCAGYYSLRIYGTNQTVEDNIFYKLSGGTYASPIIGESTPYTSSNNLWEDGTVAIPDNV